MQARADQVRSENFGQYVPYEVTRSSESFGWRGFRVEVVRGHAEGDLALPALDQHLLNVILSVPTRHYHSWDGVAREETGQEGAISLVPAGRPSHWRWKYVGAGTPCDFHIHVQPAFLRRVAADSLCELPRHAELRGELCFYHPQLRTLAAALADEVEAGGAHGPLYAESLATALLTLVLKRQQPDSSQKGLPKLSIRQVRTVCEYIDAHLAEPLHLEVLGELVGLGPERLRLVFHDVLGRSPYGFVMSRRVEEARRLLASTRLPLTEIAMRLGFADHSHFTSAFRREAGITPSRYRAESAR
jgi:AraC family transcriptional regulator